jgi:hypothetical protein
MPSLAEMVDLAVPLTSRVYGEASQLWDVPLDEEPDEELAGDPGELAMEGAVEDEPPPLPSRLRTFSGRGVLGATPQQRINMRKRMLRACWLGYVHRDRIDYTQDAHGRWGINQHRWSVDDRYPDSSDCSGYSAYLFRDASRILGLHDFVNGFSWLYGYTGTMTRHGDWIPRPTLIGDQIFLRGTWSVPGHVQTYIGHGRAFSHGSQRGPLIVPWNNGYVVQVRRYLR